MDTYSYPFDAREHLPPAALKKISLYYIEKKKGPFVTKLFFQKTRFFFSADKSQWGELRRWHSYKDKIGEKVKTG